MERLGSLLCKFPAGTAPKGVTPNFENPPTYAPAVIAVTVIVLFFAALFTGCRLLANLKSLTWSDRMLFALPYRQDSFTCLTSYRSQFASPDVLYWAKRYHACSYVLAVLGLSKLLTTLSNPS